MFNAKDKLTGAFGSIKEKVSGEDGIAAGIANSAREFASAAAEQLPDIVDDVVDAKIHGRSATSALQGRLESVRQQEIERCLHEGLAEAQRVYQESLEASAAEQRYGAQDVSEFDEDRQGGLA